MTEKLQNNMNRDAEILQTSTVSQENQRLRPVFNKSSQTPIL
jgi:hypothetical protein